LQYGNWFKPLQGMIIIEASHYRLEAPLALIQMLEAERNFSLHQISGNTAIRHRKTLKICRVTFLDAKRTLQNFHLKSDATYQTSPGSTSCPQIIPVWCWWVL
jgi:hypothetical protein